ncbi:MAG: hypothetical protein ACOCXH_11770 [Cyclobacteriaceae bacterium]
MRQFLNLPFRNKSIDQLFDNIFIVFVHFLNGFKLVDQFRIGKFGFCFFIRGSIDQEIRRNVQRIGNGSQRFSGRLP